jgi:hypothetical protein
VQALCNGFRRLAFLLLGPLLPPGAAAAQAVRCLGNEWTRQTDGDRVSLVRDNEPKGGPINR